MPGDKLSSTTKCHIDASPINALTVKQEDAENLNNLVNVKKEENTMSPDMSPVGFGSIGNVATGSVESTGRSITPVKLNELSSIPSSNANEKMTGANETTDTSIEDVVPSIGNNLPSDTCGSNPLQTSMGSFNTNSNINSSMGNCMDQMQQQNHIFVFSTQLANKGADAVLNGQFPTIIAYHCTQPATKNFLEEFFIKNPIKMSKLQRQNALNICNMNASGMNPWSGGCNPMLKTQPKGGNLKGNFGSLGPHIENKPHPLTLRPQPNIGGFNESSDGPSNENELMCWQQSRNAIENRSENHPMKPLERPEMGGIGTQPNLAMSQHGPNKAASNADSMGDCNIPSLQGVKVPDENLTPQQRQHREEQLAKLKKMNQFLFPESGNEFRNDGTGPLQGNNQMGKIGLDGGNLPGLMVNFGGNSSGMGPAMGNTGNAAARGMPTNIGSDKNVTCNPEHVGIGNEGMLGSGDMAADVASLPCNPNKGLRGNNTGIGTGPNLGCVPGGGVLGGMHSNANGMPTCHTGNVNGPAGPSGLMPNSPETLSNFNQVCGSGDKTGNSGPNKAMGVGMNSQELNQVGMTQMEWAKLQQHQFFEERMKGNKGNTDMSCIPPSLCRSNSNGGVGGLRPNMHGVSCAGPSSTVNSNQAVRSAQGPPPPYHPTQRSASVPIATQSPNPSSPNNPTSNLSLPSPCTAGGTLGIPSNSPNMDIHTSNAISTSSTTISAPTVTSTAGMASTNVNASVNAQAKNIYMQDGSPTNNNNNNTGNNNRNRSCFNQFNSNPSTPLSHMSPKDIDNFNSNAAAGDLKNVRPSPQRSKTPLMNPNNNVESAGDSQFANTSPGINFPPHMQSGGPMNTYKAPGPIERQNSAPLPSQFCRRTDNLPLNPNSNRPPQNKLNHSFDPISSLAQMSQQLTGCVSLNSGVGNNPNNMGVMGSNDMNMPSNLNPNMENMIGMESGLDPCNPNASGNMGMPPHLNGPMPFNSNNCHMNSMLGPMGPRLLNPKMCGGFNSSNGPMRDGPGGFHDMMPSHRMMGRMPVNFGNFNVSPNVQVKASTPNTIQYMPVRPQNSNASTIRMPPSLEFLQRYANPQMAGAPNIIDNVPHGNQGVGNSAVGSGDGNKLSNNPGNNFFQNCNQMGPMSLEQEEMSGGGMLQQHDMNIGPHGAMMRGGVRPMRPHNIGGHPGGSPGGPVTGPRMQAPGVNMIGPSMSQFANSQQEQMECSDDGLFGPSGPMPGAPVGPQGYGGGGAQKPGKAMGAMCSNMNSPNNANNGPIGNPGVLHSEQNPALHSGMGGPNSAAMLGPGNSLMSNMIPGGNNALGGVCGGGGGGGGVGVGGGGNGNMNYKGFVGPTSNDLKYAQQYHSFQQQLYATTTRSQQGLGSNNIVNNPSNPFFVNK